LRQTRCARKIPKPVLETTLITKETTYTSDFRKYFVVSFWSHSIRTFLSASGRFIEIYLRNLTCWEKTKLFVAMITFDSAVLLLMANEHLKTNICVAEIMISSQTALKNKHFFLLTPKFCLFSIILFLNHRKFPVFVQKNKKRKRK
jgi:hypothetical protein